MKLITFMVVSVFFSQNSLAKPPDSKSSSSSSKSSSSAGRADRDQQGGGSSSASKSSSGSKSSTSSSKSASGSKTSSSGSKSVSTGRADRDQQGGSSSSSGSKSTSISKEAAKAYTSSTSTGSKSTSTGRSDRDQQGGSSSPSSSSGKKSSTTMTRSQAQDYTSAMSPSGTSAARKKANGDAAYAGHRAAELGYKQEPTTDLYSGAGLQNEYQRDFYKGVKNYYDKTNTAKDQRSVPSGPVEAMLKPQGSRVTTKERKLADVLDEGYRQGKIDISVPGKTFDGKIVEKLNNAQKLALRNTVVVLGDNDYIRENLVSLSAKAFATDQFFTENDIAMGGLVVVGNKNISSSEEVNAEELRENLVAHELDHAADKVIQNLAEKELKKTNLSPEERALAQEAYDVATILNNRVLVTQVENAPGPNGTVIKEETKRKIQAINPDFLKNDEYFLRLGEIQSYMAEPNSPVADLAGQVLMGSNTSLTLEEANEIAKTISESPALDFINEVTESFSENQLGKN